MSKRHILPSSLALNFGKSFTHPQHRGGLGTLFHQHLVNELSKLGIDNIQCFSVELENLEGEIERTYSLINVIVLLEAVDEKESIIEPRATGGAAAIGTPHF